MTSATPLPSQARIYSNARQTAGTGEVKERNSSDCRQGAKVEQSGTAEAKEGSSNSMPCDKMHESDMGEVKEQRSNRRNGPRGSGTP